MTATPKIYHPEAKNQAQENDVLLCSMDDEDIYGQEFHRLNFGEAVSADLLSDYKVMVLAVDKNFVNATFQQQISDGKYVLNLDDKAKIIGCWNGLAKRILNDEEGDDTEDKTQ